VALYPRLVEQRVADARHTSRTDRRSPTIRKTTLAKKMANKGMAYYTLERDRIQLAL
jgi:hypothetical protein